MYETEMDITGTMCCKKCKKPMMECSCESESPFDILGKHVSKKSRDKILNEAAEEVEAEADKPEGEESSEEKEDNWF